MPKKPKQNKRSQDLRAKVKLHEKGRRQKAGREKIDLDDSLIEAKALRDAISEHINTKYSVLLDSEAVSTKDKSGDCYALYVEFRSASFPVPLKQAKGVLVTALIDSAESVWPRITYPAVEENGDAGTLYQTDDHDVLVSWNELEWAEEPVIGVHIYPVEDDD